MYQNSANSNAFLMGSAKLIIPSSSGGFVDLGAARNIKISDSFDAYRVEVDNCPEVVIGAKNQKVMVEGVLLEVNFQKLARMRNGLDTFSTATFQFDTGGNVVITPQALYVEHTVSATQTVTATIYYASVTQGIEIPFPSDSGTTVAEIPFKFEGRPQSTRTAGQQLYNIVDTRTGIYDSLTFPYTSTGY